ncbi:hypothetical protein P4054_22350 [Pseudomonas aeruginosa]|nr:hypothetical protein [Pseudomonas aeruginosa]MDF5987314.1 hypothetical protein [Pseudomonas aeruginosa]
MTYKSATVDVIEALTNSGKTFECLFEGENAAGTQRRIQARYFRCRLNPSSQQDWLNTEDFLAAEATAKVLMDPTKVGAGKVEVLQHQEGTGYCVILVLSAGSLMIAPLRRGLCFPEG